MLVGYRKIKKDNAQYIREGTFVDDKFLAFFAVDVRY